MNNSINVLLVEDSPTDRLMAEDALSDSQFEVQTSQRLEEALTLLTTQCFDVILLDLGLPDSQGLDTLRRLRGRNPQVPVVVVLTGKNDEELALQALKEGAHDYLVKDELQGGSLQRAIRYAMQRFRSENLFRQSEERYRTLVAATTAIVWDTPASGKFEVNQPGWAKFTGQTFEQLRDWGWLDAIHPDDRDHTSQVWEVAFKTHTLYQVEHRVRRADGEYRQMSVRAVPIQNANGTVREWLGVHTDVTDQKRVEVEREDLLSRLQLHIERMPLAYVLHDVDSRIIDWNPTAEKIFGYAKAEMLGTAPPFEKFVPRALWEQGTAIRNRIRSGDMDAHSVNENLTKNGDTVVCQWFNTPLLDHHGTFVGYLCLAQDVTEQKSLEAQFHQAQKMEAVGQLAGGVAHDFNNLLTIINGYSEIILDEVSGESPIREFAQAIENAGKRAAALTRQLLAFSRTQILEPRSLNLNTIVTDTARMLQRLIGEDIELVTVLEPALGFVMADPGQIEQVIMNLIVNARDAMPLGGKLTITTKNTQLDEADTQAYSGVCSGHYIELSVSDSGTGMNEATKSRIFEPFFTTKEAGRGTGLGLATVFGIIKQSAGHIAVHSELGAGSTFKLYLPEIDNVDKSAKTLVNSTSAPKGSETILLAEDEPTLRALTLRVLETQGYKVLEASNGEEAFRIAKEYQGKIDLLVTDVVMPVMGGRQLAERVVALQSKTKVLYVSGYTDDAVVRHGVLRAETAFLQKPFTPSVLAAKVREVLDNPFC